MEDSTIFNRTVHEVVMSLIRQIDYAAASDDFNVALSWLDEARILMNFVERMHGRI